MRSADNEVGSDKSIADFVEGARRDNGVNLISLAKHEGNVLFAGEGLDGALLDNFNDFWLAVGVNLLVGNGFDELTVIFEDVVHLVFQLNSARGTFSFFSLRSFRLAFVTEIFS